MEVPSEQANVTSTKPIKIGNEKKYEKMEKKFLLA